MLHDRGEIGNIDFDVGRDDGVARMVELVLDGAPQSPACTSNPYDRFRFNEHGNPSRRFGNWESIRHFCTLKRFDVNFPYDMPACPNRIESPTSFSLPFDVGPT